MRFSERKKTILDLLEINDTLSIHDLENLLDSSTATIRRDLAEMEKEGLLTRTWGGIKKIDTPETIRENSLKHHKMENYQQVIGKIAAELVDDNDMIFIGSGMTTLAMISYLEKKNIHVVTNGIPQLEALHRKNIQALLLCGFFKEYSRSLVGKETVEMLKQYKFDKAFLGVNGFDDDLCLLSADEYEDSIKHICIENSKKVFLLAGNNKFSRTAYYSVSADQAQDAVIITDQMVKDTKGWQECDGGYLAKIKNIHK